VNLTDEGTTTGLPSAGPPYVEGTLPHTDISSGGRLRIVAKLREHQFILEKWGPNYIFPFRVRIRKWARNLLLGMKVEKKSTPEHRLRVKLTDMSCPFARSMKSASSSRKDWQKTIFCGD
jgi:hypothetical protein